MLLQAESCPAAVPGTAGGSVVPAKYLGEGVAGWGSLRIVYFVVSKSLKAKRRMMTPFFFLLLHLGWRGEQPTRAGDCAETPDAVMVAQPRASVFGLLGQFSPRAVGGDSPPSCKSKNGQVLLLRAKRLSGPKRRARCSRGSQKCLLAPRGRGHTWVAYGSPPGARRHRSQTGVCLQSPYKWTHHLLRRTRRVWSGCPGSGCFPGHCSPQSVADPHPGPGS